ncbi:MAG TPA: TonB-dependent receptor, partial [Arachidicoccus sp.]|nr:TonB-dependent receptor [Arachidicoccus sp.]
KDHPEQFKNKPTYTDPERGGYDLMPQYAVDESWGPKLEGQTIRPYYSFDKDKNNPYFGVTAPWSAQPDNVRNFFKTGITLTNSVSVGGGNEDGAFRLSYSNMTQNYIMPGSKQVRNNIGFNGSHALLPNLRAIVSANYSVNDVKGRIGTGFSGLNPMELFSMYSQRQLDVNMLKYYMFPDGSQVSWNRKAFDDPTPASATSPYWNAYNAYETDTRKRLYGQAGLEYKPVDWLNLTAKVFMDEFSTLQEERSPQDLLSGQTGGYARTDIDHQEFNYQFMANAKKDLNSWLSLNATVGGNIMTQEDGVNIGSFTGLIVPGLYNLTNSSGRVTYSNYLFRKRINSLFADLLVNFADNQYLELTGRNDWASTLAAGNNSYFYPSASYSMIFSNWLTKWKWLSYGKFRASVAQIGSDTDPYRTSLAYGAPVAFGGGSYIQKDPNLFNPALKPERSTEYETGVELKFLNNRIGLDLTAYSRTTQDLIIPLSISSATGYNTFYANAGKSRNQGIEVQLSGRPIQTKNFTWEATLNFSTNKSELLSLDIPNNPDIQGYIVGTERRRHSVSTEAIVGQPLFVLTGTDYTYMNGQKVIDSSGHYVPSEPGQIIGNTEPDFIGGFSNRFTYKNVSLSALVDFQKGGNFFSYTNMYGLSSGLVQETVDNNIRETGIDVTGVLPSGEPYTKHLNAADYFKNNFGTNINAANVYDASNIYLREVTLGYQLPDKWASAIRASHATISLYGRNLWLMYSKAPNVDPSNLINSTGNITGMEGGALPSVRSYGVNLNIGF